VDAPEGDVDPQGACIGRNGVRQRAVTSELGEEQVQIVAWSADPGTFVMNSLIPAAARGVDLDLESRTAHISVAPDQLSLAIGRGGRPSTRQHGRTGEQGGQVQPRRTARTPMPAHGASRFGSGSTCSSHPAPAADREERKSARRSGGVSLRAGAVAAGRYPSHAKAVTTVLSAKASGRRRTFGRTRATPSGARAGRPARPSWPVRTRTTSGRSTGSILIEPCAWRPCSGGRVS